MSDQPEQRSRDYLATLFQGPQRTVLAFSGGKDSLVLADNLAPLYDTPSRDIDYAELVRHTPSSRELAVSLTVGAARLERFRRNDGKPNQPTPPTRY